MTTFSSFLDMGGYGTYVWPSYAIAALVLIGLLVTSVTRLRANRRTLARLEAQRPSRRDARRRNPD